MYTGHGIIFTCTFISIHVGISQTLEADVRSKYQTEKCCHNLEDVLNWESLRTSIVISVPFDTMMVYYIWQTSTNVMCIVNISMLE